MDIEDLVIDLEYAKQLNSMGIKQDSLFLYTQNIERYENNSPVYKQDFTLRFPKEGLDFLNYNTKTKLSAFTSEELLEILPKKISVKHDDYYLQIGRDENIYDVAYQTLFDGVDIVILDRRYFVDNKLSNALAKLLSWCIEKSYVEVRNNNGN